MLNITQEREFARLLESGFGSTGGGRSVQRQVPLVGFVVALQLAYSTDKKDHTDSCNLAAWSNRAGKVIQPTVPSQALISSCVTGTSSPNRPSSQHSLTRSSGVAGAPCVELETVCTPMSFSGSHRIIVEICGLVCCTHRGTRWLTAPSCDAYFFDSCQDL